MIDFPSRGPIHRVLKAPDISRLQHLSRSVLSGKWRDQHIWACHFNLYRCRGFWLKVGCMYGTCSIKWPLQMMNEPARRQISPTPGTRDSVQALLDLSNPVYLSSGNFPVRLKSFSILHLISSVACEDMHEPPPNATLNRQQTDGHD